MICSTLCFSKSTKGLLRSYQVSLDHKRNGPIWRGPHRPIYGGRTYELNLQGRAIRFAAGELSNNVWGFYVPGNDV
jgi:hypothetical protein